MEVRHVFGGLDKSVHEDIIYFVPHFDPRFLGTFVHACAFGPTYQNAFVPNGGGLVGVVAFGVD